VSGPRASRWSAAHVFSFAVLREVIERTREIALGNDLRPASERY
jgi:hypothetical protein